ncbi:unnamed protein product [Psylliodes chrysocephalus]|uniref:DUF4806 domain-containing protein n=1 Tax=Psylliodes chrysocephalus TaxID=3402493 RepID=A0A9P0CIK0_9CUCU|nr:unnamed protein product [Psylliodes chrysocephala]
MASAINKQYFVVEFPKERKDGNTPMEVIPCSWLIEEDGLWPNNLKSNEFKRAVQNKTTIPVRECLLCPINIKFKTNNYERAIEKVKKLEINETNSSSAVSDDLDSPGNQTTKRRIKRNTLLNDFESNISESSDDDIPFIPKLPTSGTAKRATFKIFDEENSVSNANSNSSQITLDDTLTGNQNDEQIQTFFQLLECTQKMSCKLDKMMTKIEVISKEMQYLRILVQKNNSSSNNIQDVDNQNLKNLPAVNHNNLIEFDKALDNQEVFADICTIFKAVGGRDYLDCVRRVLMKTVSHTLALQMNWSGRNQKLKFMELKNLRKMILAVVRNNPLSKNTSEQEVEAVIKQWLRAASDREGGRERRRPLTQ